MVEQYKTPPLVEAVCEINFEILNWDITYLADFYNIIKHQFPIKKTIEINDFQILINENGVGVNTNQKTNKPVLQCTNEIDDVIIFFSDTSLIVGIGKRYKGWNFFKDLVIDIYNSFNKVVNHKIFKNLSLSYKNTIATGDEHSYENFKKHLSLYPHIPFTETKQTITSIQLFIEIPSEDNKSVLSLQQATLKPIENIPAPIAFNLKYICLQPNEIVFSDWLEQAHNSIQNLFESSVTNFSKSKFNL